VQPASGGGVVDFAAAPSSGGPVLQQVQLLRPGRYRLEGRSSGVEQPARSLPYWILMCRDGRELGRVALSSSMPDTGGNASGEETFSGEFTVPTNCPVQTLTLIVRPSDQITGVTGQIHRAQLAPVR